MAKYKQAGGEIGPKAIYRARALAFLGLSPTDPAISEFFEDFHLKTSPTTLAGWTRSVGGTGNYAAIATAGGGWNRYTTGATAGSVAESYLDGTGQVGNVATAKWYLATHFRIQTTPDAASVLGMGFNNQGGGKTIFAGFVGPRSATDFVVQYDGNGLAGAGSAISLGAVDTNVHVIEVYGTGSAVIRARLDSGAEVSATQSAAAADFLYHFITARNGATPANQNLDVDWYMTIATRSP